MVGVRTRWLFPTQAETWAKMKTNPKTKNMCGRPGVNGGYIHDPTKKYGVNCFGVKPDESMKTKEMTPNNPDYVALFSEKK